MYAFLAEAEARSVASTRARERVASGCAGILDSDLFRALCEPVRIEIVRLLIARGRSDLSTVAAELPQDASVISRHLAVLHRAGLVHRTKRGRHVYFELDGPALLARLEEIVATLRRAVPFCCPGGGAP
jgi:DNA-binding transcriptional ArsR family regulator